MARRPLFWIALLGGIGVVATGVSLAIVFARAGRDPLPTLGSGIGN